jgi:hypothetical protein
MLKKFGIGVLLLSLTLPAYGNEDFYLDEMSGSDEMAADVDPNMLKKMRI